eukprot:scaffold192082_cov41-Prasinocladus_malaysianus.AAC.2
MDHAESLQHFRCPVRPEVGQAELTKLPSAPDIEAAIDVNSTRVVIACRDRDNLLAREPLHGSELCPRLDVIMAELTVRVAPCGADLKLAIHLNQADSVTATGVDLHHPAAGGARHPFGHVHLGGRPPVVGVADTEAARLVSAKDQEGAAYCECHAVVPTGGDGSDTIGRLEPLWIEVKDLLWLRRGDRYAHSLVGCIFHALVPQLPILPGSPGKE